MKKFTVKRSKWVRGGKGLPRLLNHDGGMCCLGFACNQICRIPKMELLGTFTPAGLDLGNSTFTENSINRKFTKYAMEINDDEEISDSEREERLTKLFADNGIQVTFKD